MAKTASSDSRGRSQNFALAQARRRIGALSATCQRRDYREETNVVSTSLTRSSVMDTNRILEKSTQPHVSFASQFTLRSDLDSEPFREICKPYTAPLPCFINSIQLFCASEKANLAPWT